MSLADTFKSAIASLDTVTKSVQESIIVTPWIDEDVFGKPTFGTPRVLKGVVDRNRRDQRLADGRTVAVVAVVTFLAPFANVGVPKREEPLDVRDKVQLQDGTKATILAIRGSMNPGTGERFFLQVTLG